MAFITAAAKNALNPNFEVSNPIQQNITIPHIKRPAIIAQNKEMYTFIFFLGNLLCSNPAINPYAANSKAMENAVGNIGGIPNTKERKIGAITPILNP